MFNMNQFRIVSMVEGISFLLLLFVAMPAKYYWGIPEATKLVGMTHGLLFLAYVAMAVSIGPRHGWSEGRTFMVVLLGMLPFGCFVVEHRLKREMPATA